MGHIYIYSISEYHISDYIWLNYKDLTVLPSPGIMVNKGNHPKIDQIYRGLEDVSGRS